MLRSVRIEHGARGRARQRLGAFEVPARFAAAVQQRALGELEQQLVPLAVLVERPRLALFPRGPAEQLVAAERSLGVVGTVPERCVVAGQRLGPGCSTSTRSGGASSRCSSPLRRISVSTPGARSVAVSQPLLHTNSCARPAPRRGMPGSVARSSVTTWASGAAQPRQPGHVVPAGRHANGVASAERSFAAVPVTGRYAVRGERTAGRRSASGGAKRASWSG